MTLCHVSMLIDGMNVNFKPIEQYENKAALSSDVREQLISSLQLKHCLETMAFMQEKTPLHLAKPVKKLLHFCCGPSHKQKFRKRLAPTFTGP
ncbi:hypothetical protein TNCV_87531 [Trichonephila clavipes]|nr:hypothetical protein TNCV_87531 [Trichonephila clavipes]